MSYLVVTEVFIAFQFVSVLSPWNHICYEGHLGIYFHFLRIC